MADEQQPEDSTPLHSKWRPVGAWICIGALGYELVLVPLFTFILDLYALYVGRAVPALAHVDKIWLIELIGIFVVARSVDKYNGVAPK